ncbi:MAG: biotin--[acetyl-CoA-carboxylase] ligase [Ignavibacteriae bacterium]|nr:biotin--[acetyl-CoA-carboxylase] ligase [Ignavibacteriota bacterium]
MSSSFHKHLIILDSIDSTNTYLKSIASEVNEGTIVLAEEQTAGRGRFSRAWVSQKYKNLTFSILFKPKTETDKLGLLSLRSGTAIVRGIKSSFGAIVTCKWPNDILINGKKVCGILSEVVKDSRGNTCMIVGIGINVNQTEFPVELQSLATSLAIEQHCTVDRLTLLSHLLHELEHGYQLFQAENYTDIIQEWKQNSTMLGQLISVEQDNSIITGIASDIANDGALIIQTKETSLKVYAGDVTIKKEYHT